VPTIDLKLFVVPKYADEALAALSYEEESFSCLLSLTESPDSVTKVAAISALGKLTAPARDVKDPQVFKASSHRDRIVTHKAFIVMLEACKSPEVDISKAACAAVQSIVPDMQQFLQILPLLMRTSNEGDTVLSSWAAYTFFRLLYTKHRPFYDETAFEPAPVWTCTQLQCNSQTFPYGEYAKSPEAKNATHVEARFPLAMNVNVKFHPKSAINFHQKLDRDAILLYDSKERTNAIQKFDQKSLADAVSLGSVFELENTTALYMSFLCELPEVRAAPAPGAPESNPPEGVSFDGVGFAAEICAEYPFFETLEETATPYSTSDAKGSRKDPCLISFEYALRIQIVFEDGCNTAAEDKLVFYRDAHCKEEEKVFFGPTENWEDFTYEGNHLVRRRTCFRRR
jgi:hypothetical protein